MDLRDMGVFDSLDRDKVDGIIEVLNDGMARDPLYGDRLRDLEKLGLSGDQARDVINWFYDFYIGARNPALMAMIMEAANAGDKGRDLAMYTFRRIVDERNWPDTAHGRIPVRTKNAGNEDGFNRFVYEHRNDPAFKGKFVAFVHGKYQGCGASENALMRDMLKKFGYVNMFVGPVTPRPHTLVADAPELA